MTDDDLYRQLQRHLDRMPVPFPATESGVEISLLKRLFTPEDARVALALSMLPERVSTIQKRLRREMDPQRAQTVLDGMAERGLITRLPGGDGPRYGKAPLVVGFYESQVNRLTEGLERDFLKYMDDGFAAGLAAQPTLQMRTVPIRRPIALPESPVARYDDITEFVRTTKGPFAAMNCICQQGHDLISQPCRVTSNREHCLTFGMAARMIADRGVGRLVTREEMLGFLERADREGLVLQPQNTVEPLFVCTCCGCCCGILTTAKKFPRPLDFFSANYHAEVNTAECQECGTCAGRCQMEAVSADGAPATVDLSRCIGCGLCVSTCPSGAMRLVANEQNKVPPGDTMKLYAQMFRERFGTLKFAAAIGRNMLGMKT
jgi:electron transport complex protein RnfB